MIKTLITYSSLTGNTRKIAESIFKAIPDNKELKNLSEVVSLDEYGLVFIGFPIYNFEPVKQAKEFMQTQTNGKNIAIFMTMALTSAPQDEQTTQLYNLTIKNCRNCADRAKILGVFDSPGELSEKAAIALINSNDPQLKAFGMMRSFSIGFPNNKNLKDAELFAKKTYSQFIS
jgi:menaquinone-dependent protoporphyrinogen IX oxidase